MALFSGLQDQVPTSYPLWDMFENREAFGRIGKWATQLAAHTIDFVPRSAIKFEVLADFIADWTPTAPSQSPTLLRPYGNYNAMEHTAKTIPGLR